MTKQRAPFMPVTPDFDDDQLERLAHDKGVGAMVRPAAQQISVEAPVGQGAQATVSAPAKPRVAKPSVSAATATPRSEMKTVNLELPAYVWTDLKIRAAHKQTSVRHIVMAALKAHGVEIAEVDMIEDGRRLRT
jgi:hypothetical protein